MPWRLQGHAQAFAGKPIRVLVGVPAGGTQDMLTRAIADQVRNPFGPLTIDKLRAEFAKAVNSRELRQQLLVNGMYPVGDGPDARRQHPQLPPDDPPHGRRHWPDRGRLAAQRQADNTLVVFTADNGGERFSDNWPLVGGRMDLTEDGIRVPWIAHWPARIAAGGASEQHCMTMDWSATFLDAAGVQAAPRYPLDGISLLPALRDARHRFDRPLYWRMNHRGQRALRDGDWKYLRVDGNDYLFDIPADERERANRAPREPQRLEAMRAAWETWNATMPPIPDDATVSLGFGVKDMPQR